MTGPSAAVRGFVIDRDRYACQWCGRSVFVGGYSIHHRRPRGAGGTKRADANSPVNLITVHGSGTTGCHGYIESHREEARERGFLVSLHHSPADRPVRDHVGRWWFLLPDGRREECTAPEF